MAQDIDCRVLIDEVRKRTPIYDTTSQEYRDRSLKKVLWEEICEAVYSPSVWHGLSNRDKEKYEKEVQKRWKSLRHCFRREVVTQKNTPPGGKKKRKYLHYDSLKFLLPFTEGLNTDGSLDEDEEFIEKPEIEARFEQSQDDMISIFREGSQTLCHNGPDDDELFLRSLIPYMKDFTGDEKLMLRMEIIKSILNFRQSIKETKDESRSEK